MRRSRRKRRRRRESRCINETCNGRSGNENRRASARRGAGGRGDGQGHGCSFERHGVARSRTRHERARSARRVGVHPAYLRRLHDGARAVFRTRRRGCARHPHSDERKLYSQYHGGLPDGAGSSRAFLSSACARLGQPRRGSGGRPGRGGEPAGGDPQAAPAARRSCRAQYGSVSEGLPECDARILRGIQAEDRADRQERPARHLCGELVGSSRLQDPAARGSSHRGRSLP